MKKALYTFSVFWVASSFMISCNTPSGKTSAGTTAILKDTTMDKEKMTSFGRQYAMAWSSQNPAGVAAFFAHTGSLKVNADTPAVGREAITTIARGFMTAFPDMIVAMDTLMVTSKGIEFHWTLTGTNSGTGGTGKKVKISGFEIWHMDKDGLIQKSIGSFDANEYSRQLKEGYQ